MNNEEILFDIYKDWYNPVKRELVRDSATVDEVVRSLLAKGENVHRYTVIELSGERRKFNGYTFLENPIDVQ